MPIIEKRAWLSMGFEDIAYGSVSESGTALRLALNNNRLILEEREDEAGGRANFFALMDAEKERADEEKISISPQDRRYLNLKLSTFDNWFSSSYSREDIVSLHHQTFALGSSIRHSFSNTSPKITGEIFIHLLARYLTAFSTWDAFFSELDRLEEEGIPVAEMIADHRGLFWRSLLLSYGKIFLNNPLNLNSNKYGEPFVLSMIRFFASRR